jgi:hypothetical protein
VAAFVALAAGLLVVACSKPIDEEKKEARAAEVITCDAPSDCPETTPECRFGLCVRPCAADEACAALPGTSCSVQGICEAGCRGSESCPDGKVCAAGVCVDGAACTDKCGCDVGQVCGASGRCQAPPATCGGPADCPRGPIAPADVCEAYACDGFTRTCQQSVALHCDVDADCQGLLHCAEGCSCEAGECEAATPCSGPADCAAPASFCDGSFFVVPTCHNGGVTCAVGQVCGDDGACAAAGVGSSCTADVQCAAGHYCALVGGQGQCAAGCRDNADCGGGQCDASHQCVGAGGAGGWKSDCTASECQPQYICGLASFVCEELCVDGCTPGVDCCLESSAARCEAGLFVAFCQN